MLILVSPAKTLDYETPASTDEYTLPSLLPHSEELIKICRELTPAQISSLMKVSDKIASLNAVRFSEWHTGFDLSNAKQSIFAFKGDVYTGLDADSLSQESLHKAQDKLRILSGLYGVLKPLDLMMPYRLEMGTSLMNGRGKNLYQFWGDLITKEINEAGSNEQNGMIVNLASNEYFKAVNKKQLNRQLITPIFKDCKNGQYKVISFYAKKARGLMARYLIENDVNSMEALIQFDVAGYVYAAEESKPDSPVFKREEQK
ncbi:peroxide stress protein YaaA [Shewanella gelidii]|uniref:UPF0246 protein GCM10009332_02630 n=1 Tax=Shewanella gelidii TaxID=1642821 RepID=A0A917JIM2_9GAMM|nr:peroxide stress protein YaaA [Shewanella gelidii]MCL1096628.1 peroxide stress protein YaaA [Shewanella gelidii]GGI68959.1 UPF0246 protein [Shewanella gelidii]